MLKVEDIMTKDPVTVTPDTEVARAAGILLEKHINGLPVVDDRGKLVGILCQSDLISQQKRIPLPSVFTILDSFIPLTSWKDMDREVRKIAASTVGDAMTPNPFTVGPETTVEEVATLMVEKKFHTIPVVQGGKLVGVVGKEDVLRTLMPTEK